MAGSRRTQRAATSARAALVDLQVVEPIAVAGSVAAVVLPQGGNLLLLVTLRHTTPTVRPEEVWNALGLLTGMEIPRPVSTRLRQGQLAESEVVDPRT